MNIYLVQRTDSVGYDEYDGFVVVAETEDKARCFHPNGYLKNDGDPLDDGVSWAEPRYIKVTLIGKLETFEGNARVILASFNAG